MVSLAASFLASVSGSSSALSLVEAALDGAGDGIRYYLTPQWEKLFTMQVIYKTDLRVYNS